VNKIQDPCVFIPDDLAAEKERAPKRRFNDPFAREWTEAVIRQYRCFYPDVTYHLDWADNTVNAFAWVDNGVRHIAIKGGLVRDADIGLEAIALVIAHELSHHYGGSPTFPSGLSCEGQADYYGVLVVMRGVWFGEQYITYTSAAIAQMANFFGVPDSETAPGGSAGCNHPPGDCRVATYHRAVNLQSKPACAS
jgi:Peptidase family M48